MEHFLEGICVGTLTQMNWVANSFYFLMSKRTQALIKALPAKYKKSVHVLSGRSKWLVSRLSSTNQDTIRYILK